MRCLNLHCYPTDTSLIFPEVSWSYQCWPFVDHFFPWLKPVSCESRDTVTFVSVRTNLMDCWRPMETKEKNLNGMKTSYCMCAFRDHLPCPFILVVLNIFSKIYSCAFLVFRIWLAFQQYCCFHLLCSGSICFQRCLKSFCR